MRLRVAPLFAAGLLALPRAPLDDPALRGFTAEHGRTHRVWEARFRSIPRPDSLRSYMRQLSARPHHIGSAYGRTNAEWMLDRFRSFGFEARIDTFEVLFPTPTERIVELVAPTRFRARMVEPALAEDPTTSQRSEQLPTYNAYSIDGDVTGPLVYVNYGVPEDYEILDRMGISVKGAIVIARYGVSWRGIKPKVAAEHGAIGCILYSDPRDDGYGVDDPYPAGPSRPKNGAQRGSVADMPRYSGDPFTPFKGARPGIRPAPFDSSITLTRIPVLPIAWGDAVQLLSQLQGRTVPPTWGGGLPFTYHVGPGPARVHLRVAFNWRPTLLFNVVASLRGTDFPDEWVLRGNHHDAWVNGADDPIAGLVAELEEARALGELRRAGWAPRRTIVYHAWDAEEPGLLGSTEYVEDYAEELTRNAVAYINTDDNGRGYLGVAGSHGLERLVNDVAKDVEDPETGLTVWKRLQLRRLEQATADSERNELRTRADLRIGALGSGSDFTPFLQHLGIASVHVGFGGEAPGSDGVYHSIYDSFAWYTRFADTSFVYGRALAQTAGTLVMRLADADILPWHFPGLAGTVSGYVTELTQLAERRQKEIAERNRQIDDGVFAATSDPRSPLGPPKREDPAPFLNWAPLENASARLTRAADRYEAAFQRLSGSDAGLAQATAVNALIRQSERELVRPGGLPGRPWYVHDLYAPGLYTGYGVKTVPSVREPIEVGRWTEAGEQIGLVAETLEREASLIERAAALLEAAGR